MKNQSAQDVLDSAILAKDPRWLIALTRVGLPRYAMTDLERADFYRSASSRIASGDLNHAQFR